MLGITSSAPPTSDQRARIDAAIQRLAESPTGAAAAAYLTSGEVDLRVMPDAPAWQNATFGRFFQRVSLDEDLLDRPELASVLGHEAIHAMEVTSAGDAILDTARRLGSGIAAAATAPLHLRNPVTAGVDAMERVQQDREVRAYTQQATIEAELGIDGESDTSPGTRPDGTPASEEELRAIVEERYGSSGPVRLATGVMLGSVAVAGGYAADTVLGAAIPKLRTGPSLMMLAGAAAVASVGWDQARRIEWSRG